MVQLAAATSWRDSFGERSEGAVERSGARIDVPEVGRRRPRDIPARGQQVGAVDHAHAGLDLPARAILTPKSVNWAQ